MILIDRGAEPAALGPIRTSQLAVLRTLGQPPSSSDIGKGYKVVAENLWKAQHYKCCYCEQKIRRGFNDVEHFRPKASADRRPGCVHRYGYWWLAYTWENLLFACPSCNRSAKNDKFPLNHGSIPLQPENPAPGNEHPLLLNPGSNINPVEHIEFVLQPVGPIGSQPQWWARPRNGSQIGHMTIDVCDLNNAELRELRKDHFDNVIAIQIKALNNALAAAQRGSVQREFDRAFALLNPTSPYVAFTYDALRSFVPDSKLRIAIHKSWPIPSQVGL